MMNTGTAIIDLAAIQSYGSVKVPQCSPLIRPGMKRADTRHYIVVDVASRTLWGAALKSAAAKTSGIVPVEKRSLTTLGIGNGRGAVELYAGPRGYMAIFSARERIYQIYRPEDWGVAVSGAAETFAWDLSPASTIVRYGQ